MVLQTIQGSELLAKQIKSRRHELGLTIEEAASRAGVGTKTWSRYEAGESIRKDKCKGICKALNWQAFPGQEKEENVDISIRKYRKHGAWSKFLETAFGVRAAMAFAAGSDTVLDYINEDILELASMPVGTHIGQLGISWLYGELPEQFLMYYDYNFLYQLKCTVCELRARAKCGASMEAHNVLEELAFYLCSKESAALIELTEEDEESRYTEDWVFDLFGDMDIITYLYSDMYLETDDTYHFCHWNDRQFYMKPTNMNTCEKNKMEQLEKR